jgi:hypothetical protein
MRANSIRSKVSAMEPVVLSLASFSGASVSRTQILGHAHHHMHACSRLTSNRSIQPSRIGGSYVNLLAKPRKTVPVLKRAKNV